MCRSQASQCTFDLCYHCASHATTITSDKNAGDTSLKLVIHFGNPAAEKILEPQPATGQLCQLGPRHESVADTKRIDFHRSYAIAVGPPLLIARCQIDFG